jgi:phage gp46-like protein
MSDITTLWKPELGVGDWAVVTPDLLSGDDLLTAVVISLFSDAEAGPDDVIPDGSDNPRGWWAGPIGSRIWLRARSKQLATVPALVKRDIADALAWMIEDGVAAAIDVTAEWTKPGLLGAEVTIRRIDGTRAALRFSNLWEAI